MSAREVERLRQLLRHSAVVYSTKDCPLSDAKGRHIPWIYYNWGISLTEESSRLAGSVLLDRLQGFRSTQIAGYGLTALPLVCSCVLAGNGRYSGLCVRAQREQHGTRRYIEGIGD